MAPIAPPHFDALTIVSPLAYGGEQKNQDRACWFAHCATAALCDGVTSSPRSAEAAELVSSLSSMLFHGNLKERLGAICDALLALRLESLEGPFDLPAGTSPQMRQMLEQVARDCMAHSFQTTLVTAGFTASGDETLVELVRCGDSAFFAYSPAGDLLGASPAWGQPPNQALTEPTADHIRFGPGDEVLVKVLGRASDVALRSVSTRLELRRPGSWLVCRPLDACHHEDRANRGPRELPTHWLTPRDLLVVPVCQIGRTGDSPAKTYTAVRYASAIRLCRPEGPLEPPPSFVGKGSVTEVLPDHYAAGHWVHRQERFPADTHFILASDGFYSAFQNPGELWAWLERHRTLLGTDQQTAVLARLHARLHARSGDDDISLVWVFPNTTNDHPPRGVR